MPWSAPFVMAMTFRNLRGNVQFAEDACQEVFLRLIRFAPFDKLQEPVEFRRYLARMSRNTALTHVLERVLREVPQRNLVFARSRSHEILEFHEPQRTTEIVQDLQEGLKPVDLEILRLLLEGYTVSQVKDRTGTTTYGVWKQLENIREFCLKLLGFQD